MKIEELLAREDLKNKKVLKKIVEFVEGISGEDIIKNPSLEIKNPGKVLQLYREYSQSNKPLEYILGEVEVFGYPIKVDERVLIPRPETEYLIKAAVEEIQQNVSAQSTKKLKHSKNILIDVGTGSGVLASVVMAELLEAGIKDFFDKILLTDISEEALEVAKQNFNALVFKNPNRDKNYISVKFVKANLLEWLNFAEYDKLFVLANLPYIPNQTFFENVEDNVKKREPHIAFLGGEDWLELYRKMLNQLKAIGKPLTGFFEMMDWQAKILKEEFHDFEFKKVSTFHFNIVILKVNKF